MDVFCHHLYEYRKGSRRLVLYTGRTSSLDTFVNRLQKADIAYLIDHVTSEKVNIFFGAEICIKVLKEFSILKLSDLSDTEDFILGTMLGYEVTEQCSRYVRRKAMHRRMREQRVSVHSMAASGNVY